MHWRSLWSSERHNQFLVLVENRHHDFLSLCARKQGAIDFIGVSNKVPKEGLDMDFKGLEH